MYIRKFNFPITTDSNEAYGSAGVATEQVTVSASISKNTITIQRDPIGVIPVYICKGIDSCWTISSQLGTVSPIATGINETWLEQFNKEDFSDTKGTAFKNIWRVPPGAKATITNNYVTFDQCFDFFEIDLFDSNCTEDAWLELGANILKKSILQRTLTTKSAVLVSGGFDSNLIAKLSAPNSQFYCMNFSKTPEQDQVGVDNAKIFLGENLIEMQAEDFPENSFQYVLHRDPKCIIYDPSLWLFRPLMLAAKENGATQILTGLGGDDLFQPSLNYLASFNFLKGKSELKKLRQNDLAEGSFTENIFKHLLKPKFLDTSHSIWNLNYRFMQSGRYTLGIEQEQELAQQFGLNMTYPLLDLEVIRYVLSTPAKYLLGPYAHKNLLRKIGLKFLPEDICRRVSQQDFSQWRKQILLGQWSGGGQRGELSTQSSNSSFDDLIKSRYSLLCQKLSQQEHSPNEKIKTPLPEARS